MCVWMERELTDTVSESNYIAGLSPNDTQLCTFTYYTENLEVFVVKIFS